MKRALAAGLLSLPLLSNAGPSCGDADFAAFLARFLRDAGFSVARTQWPLKVTKEHFGHVTDRISTNINSFADYLTNSRAPSTFLAANPNVKTVVSQLSNMRATVTFYEGDADVLFDLRFDNEEGCWRLTLIRHISRERY